MSDDEKKMADLNAEHEAAEIQCRIDERAAAHRDNPHSPADRRFKKGVSGNPRGRPRKSERAYTARQFNADILHSINEEVEIRTTGKSERVSMIELILRRLRRDAAQGSLGAMKLIFEIYQQALSGRATQDKKLHDLIESMEQEAVVKGHLPPNHEMFKQLDHWRKRTRKV